MISFDYLKLQLPTDSIKILDNSAFSSKEADKENEYLVFKQTRPYKCEIVVDINRMVTNLSFSGKVLLENYPLLISAENIDECIANINNIGVVYINPIRVLDEAVVVECDVTTDLSYTGSLIKLRESLMFKSNNYVIHKKCDNRFYIKNTYVTRRKQENMVIYDKALEMRKSDNKPFLAAVNNSEKQLEYFSDKIRLELNLRSVDRIRKYFQCDSTKLISILNSSTDPIDGFLNLALYHHDPIEIITNKVPKLRDLEHILLLCMCDFDLAKVEKVIRNTTSSKSSIKRKMEPYRLICENMNSNVTDILFDNDLVDLSNKLKHLLSLVFNINSDVTKNPLQSLYAQSTRERECPSWHELNPLFLFNLPTVKLSILPN